MACLPSAYHQVHLFIKLQQRSHEFIVCDITWYLAFLINFLKLENPMYIQFLFLMTYSATSIVISTLVTDLLENVPRLPDCPGYKSILYSGGHRNHSASRTWVSIWQSINQSREKHNHNFQFTIKNKPLI